MRGNSARLGAEACDQHLGLSETDVIEALRFIERGVSPEPYIRAALRLKDEITPLLLDELALAPVDVQTRCDASPPNGAYFLHTMSMFLAAWFEEPRAFSLLLDYFMSDNDLADDVSGEAVTGYLPAMLVRCYDGQSTRTLRLAIETDAFEPLFRKACLKAYIGLAFKGYVERDEVVRYVEGLLDSIPADAKPSMWYACLGIGASYLKEPHLRPKIEAIFDRGLDKTLACGIGLGSRDDIVKIYNEPAARTRDYILCDGFFAELPVRMARWSCFQDADWDVPELLPPTGHDGADHQPFVRAGPKVGRNEPCPCGSGKKYKKCYLH